MGERNQEAVNTEPLDDFFESALGEMSDDDFEDPAPVSSEKQRLAAKRRRAEQRLEERRLRDELGDYDLHLDDF